MLFISIRLMYVVIGFVSLLHVIASLTNVDSYGLSKLQRLLTNFLSGGSFLIVK